MAARSLNKAMLIGNLTRDPEIRYTGSGVPVATFAIATNKSWKDASGEQKESAQFHNIVAWNKMAEICNQLLSKGMKVYIEGEINTRSWEGDDGVTKYKTEIRVNDMILLDSKGKSGVGGNADGSATNANSSNSASSNKGADDSTSDDPFADMPGEGDSKKKSSSKTKQADEDPLSDEDLPF